MFDYEVYIDLADVRCPYGYEGYQIVFVKVRFYDQRQRSMFNIDVTASA